MERKYVPQIVPLMREIALTGFNKLFLFIYKFNIRQFLTNLCIPNYLHNYDINFFGIAYPSLYLLTKITRKGVISRWLNSLLSAIPQIFNNFLKYPYFPNFLTCIYINLSALLFKIWLKHLSAFSFVLWILQYFKAE